MTDNDNATLYTLGDRGQTIQNPANDIRGRKVKDKDGKDIGKVADLLVDDQEQKVRFLLLEHGGFLGLGEKKTLIPVDAVTEITDSEVAINQTGEHVAAAPGYNPDLVDARPHHSSIYSHYGYPPYWGGEYTYPPMGMTVFPMSPPPPD